MGNYIIKDLNDVEVWLLDNHPDEFFGSNIIKEYDNIYGGEYYE